MKKTILILLSLFFINGYVEAKPIALPKDFLCSFLNDSTFHNRIHEIFSDSELYREWDHKFFIDENIFQLEIYPFKKAAAKILPTNIFDSLNYPLYTPKGTNPDIKHFNCGVNKKSQIVASFSQVFDNLFDVYIQYGNPTQKISYGNRHPLIEPKIAVFLFQIKNGKIILVDSGILYQ